VLPRRAIAMLRLLKPSPLRYSRPYRSWDEACRNAGNYTNPALLDEELNAARTVREGRAAYALFGVPQATLAFRWPLLASLVAIAGWRHAFSGRPLHILDFGGGLGSVYDQHRRFLDTIPELSWSVVEQPHFVRCGNSEFAGDRLRFFETVEEARARGDIDAALFVSSLGYLENPYEVLAALLKLDIPYLILVATQLTDAADDVIKVQHVRPPYVTADLPIRFLSRSKLLALLDSRGYEMFADLGMGYLFRRRSGSAVRD
jgi:putative methyltransferase (TIGR04325 family)